MVEPICVFCHRGMKEVGVLSRINEKGVPGVWACREHRHLSDKKFAADLDALTDIISGRKDPSNGR